MRSLFQSCQQLPLYEQTSTSTTTITTTTTTTTTATISVTTLLLYTSSGMGRFWLWINMLSSPPGQQHYGVMIRRRFGGRSAVNRRDPHLTAGSFCSGSVFQFLIKWWLLFPLEATNSLFLGTWVSISGGNQSRQQWRRQAKLLRGSWS